MEKQEQREKEAEEAINAINKKTGRNMPQAIATAVVLIAIILACLLISVDLFVYLVVLFMVLALWELRVDFATAGLHIPVVALWACSAVTLLATYYSKHHIVAMTVCVLASLLLVAIAASAKVTFGSRLSLAVADKLSHTDAGARLESSFNHEQGDSPALSAAPRLAPALQGRRRRRRCAGGTCGEGLRWCPRSGPFSAGQRPPRPA